MSAHLIEFPARRTQQLAFAAQMDFAGQLHKLDRTCGWLDRNGVVVLAFAGSTLRGPRVVVRPSQRLRDMLADHSASRGHFAHGGSRWEQMEARDPSTGVLIVWEEERREGGPAA